MSDTQRRIEARIPCVRPTRLQTDPETFFHPENSHISSPGVTVDPETELLCSRLLSHSLFAQYLPIIYDCLEEDENHWCQLVALRRSHTSNLFRHHYSNIFNNPPPEIFDLIVEIRLARSWRSKRSSILMLVTNANQLPTWTATPVPGRSSDCQGLQAPTTASTTSRSRAGYFEYPTQPHPDIIEQGQYHSKDRLELYSPETVLSRIRPRLSVVTKPTAPKGYRFFCPSRNCKKDYSRRGDYENHLQKYHPDYHEHDPQTSLCKIAETGSQITEHAEEQSRTTVPPLTTESISPHTAIASASTYTPPTSSPGPQPALDALRTAHTTYRDVCEASGHDIAQSIYGTAEPSFSPLPSQDPYSTPYHGHLPFTDNVHTSHVGPSFSSYSAFGQPSYESHVFAGY